METKLKTIISCNVITSEKDGTIGDICKKMDQYKIGGVVIIEKNDPIGLITSSDIVGLIANIDRSDKRIKDQKVSRIMVKNLITSSPDITIKKASQIMRSNRIRHLILTDHHKLAGIVTNGDILRYYHRELAISHVRTKQLENEASRDGMTGIYTQKYIRNLLQKEVERVKRARGPLSFLMIDIDHFKKINDQYGHDCGDYIVKQVVKFIKNNSRKINIIGRYGGDEFAVIAPISRITAARRMAQRLCQKISNRGFQYDKHGIQITLSIGVAAWNYKMKNYKGLIKAADEALYTAKEKGRNQVRG